MFQSASGRDPGHELGLASRRGKCVRPFGEGETVGEGALLGRGANLVTARRQRDLWAEALPLWGVAATKRLTTIIGVVVESRCARRS